jgi:hypothetical protein
MIVSSIANETALQTRYFRFRGGLIGNDILRAAGKLNAVLRGQRKPMAAVFASLWLPAISVSCRRFCAGSDQSRMTGNRPAKTFKISDLCWRINQIRVVLRLATIFDWDAAIAGARLLYY